MKTMRHFSEIIWEKFFFILLSIFCLTASPFLSAATVTVTSNADSGAGTLRQAIADTSEGDTVVFSLSAGNETISIASELNISGKSLIIDGSNTAGSRTAVTVQVTTPGSSPWRDFNLNPGPGKTVSISKMTIKGGDISGTGFSGGCIYLYSGTLELKNSTLSGAKLSLIHI